MHHWFYLLTHVVILIFQFYFHKRFAIFLINNFTPCLHAFLPSFELGTVMITNDIGYSSLFYSTFYTYYMIEAFVTIGMFWGFFTRQLAHEFIGYTDSVNHLVLGITRMHITSLHNDLGCSSIEVFKFQFSHFTTVHGISPLTTELRYIKLMGAQTDFFIGIETDANLSMLDFRMFLQIYDGRYDFGNICLIISTQQGLSVGNNQIFSLMVEQFGELYR